MEVKTTMELYLRPTAIIDSDHREIIKKAEELTAGAGTDREKAVACFYFVRDGITYNPSLPRYLPEHFRASATLASRQGFCIPKAALLAALCRALAIPARLRFAVIRNHLLPGQLAAMLTSDELPDHGFAEIFIGGRWVRANPSLDKKLCDAHSIVAVEFDGHNHALFRSHTRDGRLHIEYLAFRKAYHDVPVGKVTEWVFPALTAAARRIILGTGES